MSEPIRIKITPDSKMIDIPINTDKLWKTRVQAEIVFEVMTWAKTEEEAGANSEEIADDLVRYLETQIKQADGLPDPDDVNVVVWGVRNTDVEEYKEEV